MRACKSPSRSYTPIKNKRKSITAKTLQMMTRVLGGLHFQCNLQLEEDCQPGSRHRVSQLHSSPLPCFPNSGGWISIKLGALHPKDGGRGYAFSSKENKHSTCANNNTRNHFNLHKCEIMTSYVRVNSEAFLNSCIPDTLKIVQDQLGSLGNTPGGSW